MGRLVAHGSARRLNDHHSWQQLGSWKQLHGWQQLRSWKRRWQQLKLKLGQKKHRRGLFFSFFPIVSAIPIFVSAASTASVAFAVFTASILTAVFLPLFQPLTPLFQTLTPHFQPPMPLFQTLTPLLQPPTPLTPHFHLKPNPVKPYFPQVKSDSNNYVVK